MQLRYANNSNYKNDEIITREVFVNKPVIDEFKRIVLESEVRRHRSQQYLPCSFLVKFHAKCRSSMHLAMHVLNCLRFQPPLKVMKEDDNNWPLPDRVGRQELEVIVGSEHTSFTCTKLGSVLQVQQSKDPDGLKTFYYLVQVRP